MKKREREGMGRSRKEIKSWRAPQGCGRRTESESHLKPASAKAAQSPPFQGGKSPSWPLTAGQDVGLRVRTRAGSGKSMSTFEVNLELGPVLQGLQGMVTAEALGRTTVVIAKVLRAIGNGEAAKSGEAGPCVSKQW